MFGWCLFWQDLSGAAVADTWVHASAGMVCTRLPTAFIVLSKGGFTRKEQIFMACSWIPKVCPLLLHGQDFTMSEMRTYLLQVTVNL